MILFKNYLIVLDYNPGTDILSMAWPSIEPYQLPEVERALQILVETIRHYDIKHLLIDARHATADPRMDEVKYREILTNFAHDLNRTRLQKSARIMAADQAREEKSRQLSDEVVKDTGLAVQRRNFLSNGEATEWLLASEPV